MNNAKWVVFGLCFLAVMAGAGVWWVETKIAQVTTTVNGVVDRVQETVNAPMEAVASMPKAIVQGIGEGVDDMNYGWNRWLKSQGLPYQGRVE